MIKSLREREFGRVLSLLGPNAWFYFVTALVRAVVIGYSFNMVIAFIKKDVLDAAVTGQQDLLLRSLTLALVTLVTGVPLWVGAAFIIAHFEKRAVKSVRVQAFDHIVDLPIDNFTQKHSGDLVSRCTNDIDGFGSIYRNQIPQLLFALFMGIFGISSIFVMNWQLGAFSLLLGLGTLLISIKVSQPLREKSNAIQASLGEQTKRLSDIIQGLPIAKMFHLEETTHKLYADANQQTTATIIEHAKIQAKFDALNAFMEWLRSAGTLFLGLLILNSGNVSLGAIIATIHLQGNASYLFTDLGNFITSIQRSLAGAARVFELLSWPKEQMDTALPLAAHPKTSSDDDMVQIKNLSFAYGSDETPNGNTLENISLSVRKGEFVALVGPSGSGKSTLMKVLMGLYPLEDHSLIIEGKPLNSYPLEELRNLTAYVPQDAYLFDGSILENIGYGNPDAIENEIITAAKLANAHDFIIEQQDGYDTLVGERGARLSGGQRQRIAIARAILKDAPILLLDEATSALDSESEALVQGALDTLMADRTTIAIAHRLSTVQHADQIYVLQSGHIVEQGTHETLLQQKGLYQELHTLRSS